MPNDEESVTSPEEKEKAAGQTAPVTLSGEINTATRSLHTSLNRLITSRLPLALPPHTNDPATYAHGLLHFAHIFLTFESLWADLLRDHALSTISSASPQFPFSRPGIRSGSTSPPMSPLLSYLLVNPYDSPTLFTSTLGAPTQPSPQLAAFLQTLRPRGLVRSGRLKKDLEHLLSVHATDLEVLLSKYPGDKVADFCTHIRKSVNEKPWTLVSYAWCFYMATFSGGRWIRRAMLNAPTEFWPVTSDGKTPNLEESGLSFWHFPGMHDGEDIKMEFKARLAEAEVLFSPDERIDIIEESKSIFDFCHTLVEELDIMLGTDLFATRANAQAYNQSSVADEKKTPVDNNRTRIHRSSHVIKSLDPVINFLRRPEIAGTFVALGCLTCVALLRCQ